MNSIRLIALMAVAAGSVSRAAEAEAAPQVPYVQTAPYGSRWSVTIKNNSQKDSGTPVHLEMLVGQNKIRQATVVYPASPPEVYYVSEGCFLQKAGNSDKVLAFHLSDEELNDDRSLRVLSFPGTYWISERNYAGIEILEGVKCYHFHDLERGDAWIRVEDRYPVKIQTGGAEYDFSPVTPYPQDVQLPLAYLSAMQETKGEARALEALSQASRRHPSPAPASAGQ